MELVDDEIEFEWDEANFTKLAQAGRGVNPELCRELARNGTKIFSGGA
jgi:hypothetical protein